ncbi:MAG: putative molybdenum carrier protein [Gammaproteobacteria bacterium]
MIKKIISGGQTRVDSAALDAAILAKITYGGWCPKGRINENGVISKNYDALKEISGNFKNEQENYDTRTKYNIHDSDGTLILVPSIPLPVKIKDGTLLTIQEVQRQKKTHIMIDLSKSPQENAEIIICWIKEYKINILNVAGPRESNSRGIYHLSLELLIRTFPYTANNYVYKSKF